MWVCGGGIVACAFWLNVMEVERQTTTVFATLLQIANKYLQRKKKNKYLRFSAAVRSALVMLAIKKTKQFYWNGQKNVCFY